RAGEITLHVGRLEADIGQGPLPLTRLEFLVLKELMEHAGQALSKGQLLESVWGYDFDPGSNIVGVCVSRLRAKIGDHLITTAGGRAPAACRGRAVVAAVIRTTPGRRVSGITPPVRVPGRDPPAAGRIAGTGPAVHPAVRITMPVSPGPGHRRRR